VPVLDDQVLIEWLRAAPRAASGRRRFARARGSTRPRGCSRARRRRRTGAFATTCARWASRWSPITWSGRAITSASGGVGRDRHGACAHRARPWAKAGGIAAAGHRVRPTASVRHRRPDQGGRQHAAPGAAGSARRLALPGSSADQPRERGVAIEACPPRAVEAAARGKSALLGCADAIAGGAALCSTSQSRIPPRGITLLDPDLWSTR
jgi:hypothetical protein